MKGNTKDYIKLLENLTGKKVKLEAVDNISSEFYDNEKKSMEELLKQANINIKLEKHLGSGENGLVWLTTDKRVVKFDTEEADVELLEKIKAAKLKHFAEIYIINSITYKDKHGDNSQGWIVVKEFVPDIPLNILKELYQVREEGGFENLEDLSKFAKTNMYAKQILELVIELKEVGLDFFNSDLFPDNNLGVKNGVIKGYDISIMY